MINNDFQKTTTEKSRKCKNLNKKFWYRTIMIIMRIFRKEKDYIKCEEIKTHLHNRWICRTNDSPSSIKNNNHNNENSLLNRKKIIPHHELAISVFFPNQNEQ